MNDLGLVDFDQVRHQGEFWITREGEKWRIGAMTADHLQSVIAYLHRNADTIQAYDIAQAIDAASSLQGEMAIDSIDQEVERMMSMSPDEYIDDLPVVEAMRDELRKRGYTE